ncbi:pseudouridine synthase [Sagittula salina]|uniref:Pseudouridine synthase n=1 Tax=Sagittula salina TaxID=2820268 RepID=A0A940MQL1_9RHOB|nr:pseudouridine synthase [Sagittula salina]MBP0482277.1 pseudouridine synthase [Sagittula salina]
MDKTPPPGDRIAKVIARAGHASRREAERMIEEGRVTVNGKLVTSPALNVTARDRIAIDEAPIAAAEEARLWLYHKPPGLVTTTKDEKGRATIFDELPEDLPRVMSVGRLDLNSEGLLLLTNDGELKRRLELPSTGWLRRYRVRVNGRPTEPQLQPLRDGITIDGERFQPMIVTLDRQQGANAWLTVGLREGKNREIRRAMTDIGLTVNRLIRISYGPFQLGQIESGAVEEVRRKVLRDQLGMENPTEDEAPKPRVSHSRKPRPGAAVPERGPRGTERGSERGKTPAAGPERKGRKTRLKPGQVRDMAAPEAPKGRSTRSKTGSNPATNPSARLGGKPMGKTAGKPSGKPSGKPIGKGPAKPAGKAGPQPGRPGSSRPTPNNRTATNRNAPRGGPKRGPK